MKVEYEDFKNDIFESGLRRLVDPLLSTLPNWVTSITLIYVDKGDILGEAWVHAQYEYRTVQVKFSSTFFGLSDFTRRRIVAHEFAHVALAPTTNLVQQVIDDLHKEREKDPTYLILCEQWRVAVESVTQDLADIYLRLLDE